MSSRIIGGKYSLEREVGSGGMGSIWIALDAHLRRRVALKLLRSERGDSSSARSARERFEREAMAIAKLQHPNVIQIYDYGIDEERSFIVMELLEGEDLASRLTRHRRLALAAMVPLITQATKALGAAHAAGIVHRDLKPPNIFIVQSGSDEIVKLLDFGVASMIEERLPSAGATRDGAVLGTPVYMSPEQTRGQATDPRSDLWSLAVVAYRALTGEFPFAGESLGDLLVAICTDAPVSPSSVAPDLGPEVDRFFERALAKDPTQRFQSAREFSSAFASLVRADDEVRPKKILFVDDEPDMVPLVKRCFRAKLRTSAYEILFASDGEAALELLRQHPDIDLVVTDLNMPRMDGLTLLRNVREVSPLLDVIIVSAYGDMTNIRAAMNLGAFDFLVKPIDLEDLEHTVAKTLKHVEETRRVHRSREENSVLRMAVSSAVLERVFAVNDSAAAPVDEPMNATVAFLAVAGLMEAARDRPPEALVRMLNANLEIIIPELTARGGVVEKLIGDVTMAVFRGEDHVHRAIDASLAVLEQLQSMAQRAGKQSPYSLGTCIGVDSGEVIWAQIGSKAISRLDVTFVGGVIHSAAALLSLAETNQILVGEHLQHTLLDAYDYERIDLGGLSTRPGPLGAYTIIRKKCAEKVTVEATTSILSEDS